MHYSLPETDKDAIELSHFPTRHQAFIFRAHEYIPAGRIAEVLGTTEENIRRAAAQMGLAEHDPGNVWLERGYITIIRRMWHILPYDQLCQLLGMSEDTLARTMREEDFLDVKLTKKPRCAPVRWRELTDEEALRTEKIKKIVSALPETKAAPFDFRYDVQKITFGGKERFKSRIIYAFSGLYQHAFDVDSESFLPDEQLKAYQSLGVNGIWTQGLLSQLAPYPFAPELSEGYEERLLRMRRLCERLGRYGIKLYLYINEPRSMPLNFFDAHPSIKGHERHGDASLCTSVDEVRKYLKDSVETVCRAVPMLGGFFTITRSENLTNCYSHSGDADRPCLCPRCKKRSVGEVISEVIGCYLEGARRVSEDIRIIAWSWRWDEHSEQIIRRLPRGVILMSQSELDIPFSIGGVKGNILDYSMSIIGPGELAKNEWRIAAECGLEVGAKVQINTTWEASTVPAIPVAPSVSEHVKRLRDEGVGHLLLSWTLGGYPCRNIAAAAKYFYDECKCDDLDPALTAAEEQFAKAFSEFPFHLNVLYNGPQNAGPSNLLYPYPTGYKSTMTCFPYDDLDGWRSIYPTEVFEEQFGKLCLKWKKGLDMLPPDKCSESAVMAWAAYCLFASSYNQIRFIRARDEHRFSDAAQIARQELEITEIMLKLMNENAAIGYEASNHYYFSKGQLKEKIVNCHHVIELFDGVSG